MEARRSHTPKVLGSSPSSATTFRMTPKLQEAVEHVARYEHCKRLIVQQDGVISALRGGNSQSLIDDALDVRFELIQCRDRAWADACNAQKAAELEESQSLNSR